MGCTIGLYAEDDSDRDEKVKALFKSFSYKRLIPVMKKKENANDTADGGDE